MACVPPPAQPVRLPAAPIRRSGAAPPYESLTVSDPFSASAARASPPLWAAAGRAFLAFAAAHNAWSGSPSRSKTIRRGSITARPGPWRIRGRQTEPGRGLARATG